VSRQYRTVALIAAALGLLVSLFIALRATNDNETTATTATTAVATAVPTEEPTLTNPGGDSTPTPLEPTATPIPEKAVVLHVNVTEESAAAGTISRFSLKEDSNVELTVTSVIADEVHVHGYDLMADVAPGAPVTIRFVADIAGVFEVELEDRGLQIAELEVSP